MAQLPRVNIVVLNYNGKNEIKKCLSSLFCLNYSNFEVVLVDNASTDGSLELAKTHFSKATFIRNESNLGFSAGNNVGIRYSLEKAAEYVLLLNNDTEVHADFLLELIRAAIAHPEDGIYSPVIYCGKSEKVWFSGGKIDWIRMKTSHDAEKITKDNRGSDFISGCSMLVAKKVFREIGLLDEDYFLYWEDVDFSVRAKKAGFSGRVVANSEIAHFEKSEGNKENKVYWLVFSGLLFFRKNRPQKLRAFYGPYFLLRRIKNKLDIWRQRGGKIAFIVEKAYKDYRNYDKKKTLHHNR